MHVGGVLGVYVPAESRGVGEPDLPRAQCGEPGAATCLQPQPRHVPGSRRSGLSAPAGALPRSGRNVFPPHP